MYDMLQTGIKRQWLNLPSKKIIKSTLKVSPVGNVTFIQRTLETVGDHCDTYKYTVYIYGFFFQESDFVRIESNIKYQISKPIVSC